jgi:hypothetical protein
MPTFPAGLVAQAESHGAPSGCQFCWFGFGDCAETAAKATKPVNATQMMCM